MNKNKNYQETLKACIHIDQTNENIVPRTEGCEDCKNEETTWIALRLCLTCGHVGCCCDSSAERHATRHFRETEHPVMAALPNKPWKWCYIHKLYG